MRIEYRARLAVAGLLASLASGPALADSSRDPLAPLPSDIIVTARRAMPVSPDLLGTAALDAGVTVYDVRFRRVAAADLADPRLRAIAGQLRGLAPAGQLARVKRIVAGQLRRATDQETLHVADYWSNAAETLARGAGDDEDIAIVEMQALKAAGFPARDLYISIGRSASRGLHAVLIARTADGFFMLDDATTEVIPASAGASAGFTPIMTIGAGRSWLHGYRAGAAPSAAIASR